MLVRPSCLLFATWVICAGGTLPAEEVLTLEGTAELAREWEEIAERSGSEEDALQYGLTLHALGILKRQAGMAGEALDHLEEATLLLRSASPAERADALEALALTRQDLGELVAAETTLREVVRLRRNLAPDADGTGFTLDHLGLNLLAQGRYPEAGVLLREVLEATPENDPAVRARRLGQYARYLHTLGSHSRAAKLFSEALALPFDDPELALALKSQLSVALLRLGRGEEARIGLEEAANEATELYRDSPRSFQAVPYLNNLGALDLSLGLPEQALPSFRQAVRLIESSLDPDHPSLISPLNNLGAAFQAIGDYDSAALHLKRAAALQAEHLPPLHLRVAETARNLARNALMSADPGAPAEVDRSTRISLGLLDELIRHGSEQERLNFLQRLDLFSLPCATGDPERIADVLIATKARLLDAMIGQGTILPAEVPDWRQVQAALPPDGALIDTCRFTPADPQSGERYGAIVLLPEGPPRWVELGSEEDLQHWISAMRRRLDWLASRLAGASTDPPALRLQGVLRALHGEFWQAIAEQLPPSVRHIAYVPHGALHFVPLAALLDSEHRPLATRHLQIVTLGSARDLLASAPGATLAGSPWAVLGISDFPKRATTEGDDRLLNWLSSISPMPGTTEELRRIRKLAPKGSRYLSGERATESALHSLDPAPAVLHLGCHAFFLGDESSLASSFLDFDERADLLYSGGLALYGAALRGPESPLVSADDDLLFPGEIAGLPLGGTRLVTLSSCESGAGTAVSGEGLLGLRRGFALAGAREVMVSLWPVSDLAAPAFMERFYQLALKSDRPAQALWQTQAEFLGKSMSEDDFELAVLRYGPFVLSQHGPLATGGPIHAAPVQPGLFTTGRLLLALPLVAFLVAKLLARFKPQ